MKNIAYRFIIAGAIACIPLSAALAADPNTVAPEAVAPQPAAPETPAKLPYGVEDVLKLSRAQINEDIILNYIHNTGTIYNLGPQEIVYLRNQGVSDRVVNAMLDQRKQVIEAAAPPTPQTTAPAVPNATTVPEAGTIPAAPYYTDAAPQYTAPEPQPASSLYVIPYPPRTYAYYGTYWPYSPYSYYGPYGYYGYPYGYYRGWCGPTVGFGFSFGGHGGYYHGGHYGGYHGGYHAGYRGGSYAGHRR